jgi:NADH-quinone oxidoreductase subunit M
LGAFRSNTVYGVAAATGVILGAAYMLWMFQRVMFGEIKNPANMKLKDLNRREIATMVPMVLLIFVMGIYPKLFFSKMDVSVEQFLKGFKAKYEMSVEASAPTMMSIRSGERRLKGQTFPSKID